MLMSENQDKCDWTNITTCSVGLLVLYLLFKYSFIERQKNLPPGPLSWPVIGTFPALGDPLHVFLTKLSIKYGPIYRLQLGNQMTVVLNDYETTRDAFVKHAEICSDRPDIWIFKYLGANKGVISANGKLWKIQRRFSLNILRGLGFNKKSFETTIQELGEGLLQEIKDTGCMPFDPGHIITTCVSNVLCSLVFGKRFSKDDPIFVELVELMDKINSNAGLSGIANVFPFLRYLPGDPFRIKQMKQDKDRSFEIYRQDVEYHRKTYVPNQARDFIDAYWEELEAFRQSSPSDSVTLTDENLFTVLGDLFAAGTETSATTLRWAILYMMHFPQVQERVQREIDDVVGNGRMPCMSDRQQLPYTDATINEILRIAPVAIQGVPHCTSDDLHLHGYLIPKGTMLISNIWAISRDPKLWVKPECFDPTHFLDSNGNINRKEEFIPFSTGRRACLGESLARMELFIFFAIMMQHFTFKFVDHEQKPTLLGTAGITLCPRPFKTIAEPR